MRSAVGPSPGASPASDGGRRHVQAPGLPGEQIVIANSTIQFIDLELDKAAVAAVGVRYFECGNADSRDTLEVPSLHQVDLDEEGVFYHPLTGEIADPAATYAVSGAKALEAFAGEWIPVPVLRLGRQTLDGSFLLEEGPSNWARLMVTRSEPGSSGPWHVVLAIDTGLAETAGESDGKPATAPSFEDVQRASTFAFSADVEAIGWFVNEPWVDEWLAETFREGRRPSGSEAGIAASEAGSSGNLTYLAHYLTLLAAVHATGRVPRLRLAAPPAGTDGRAIPVDLILDIGASRTTALLAETAPGAPAAMGPMPLRDLSDLSICGTGIFPSRVEFARANLGRDVYSRWSGRTNAFYWPSLVRTGREAQRLASRQATSDALTGLSSPMPYLWDDRASRNLWRFAGAPVQPGRRQPLVSGPLLAHLTETGELLGPSPSGHAATKPRFARAALLTFCGTELLLHAISAANSVTWRCDRAEPFLPRRLARIVLTLPATVEPAEAHQAVARLDAAVKLLWTALGWSRPGRTHVFPLPTVELAADTATLAQVAFLENEITHKFGGKARAYFNLAGRGRAGRGIGGEVKLATLDIGGASTGLAIRSWHLDETGGLASHGLLTEGFRLGAGDVARALAERTLLPAVGRRLAECRIADPQRFLASLLGGDAQAPTTRQDELRRRFATEIALPSAIRLLQDSSISLLARDNGPRLRTLADLLTEPGRGAQPGPGALVLAEEIEAIAADEGADGFELLRCEIAATRAEVAAIVRSVLGPVLDCATRTIANLGCDMLLITGWLGRLPSIAEAVRESVPMRPDRILAADQYRVGTWYPDRSETGNIADPKSLAAVGAVLASRPSPFVGGLPLRNPDFLGQRHPSLCYVGEVLGDGLIAADAVLFETSPAASGREPGGKALRATLAGEPPFVLGLRRAPLANWPALPLYRLDLAEMAADARPRMPLRITLGWQGAGSGAGEPVIVRALDADGIDLAPGEIEMRPNTLGAQDGHWLDTGHFHVDCLAGER